MPDLARVVIDELTNLVGAQGRLLRLELQADARALGKKLIALAVCVPLLLIGYVFLLLAAADALARVMGTAAAFASIGSLHAVAGVIGVLKVRRPPGEVLALERSRDEIRATVDSVTAAAKQTGVDPGRALAAPSPRGKAHA